MSAATEAIRNSLRAHELTPDEADELIAIIRMRTRAESPPSGVRVVDFSVTVDDPGPDGCAVRRQNDPTVSSGRREVRVSQEEARADLASLHFDVPEGSTIAEYEWPGEYQG